MTVLEPGPGMGFFTLELLSAVGVTGKVVAVDVQSRMLDRLRQRASRRGLETRLDARLVGGADLGVDDLEGAVDFVLAFAVVHELEAPKAFFEQVARAMKPGATMLLSEPKGHVRRDAFDKELELAASAGLDVQSKPDIARSLSVVLQRTR
jgi:SAM-dependent methyltransferase